MRRVTGGDRIAALIKRHLGLMSEVGALKHLSAVIIVVADPSSAALLSLRCIVA